MIRIQLTDAQCQALKAIRQKTDDTRSERALAVLLKHEGLNTAQIAVRLKRHYNTVAGWLQRYQIAGLDGLERLYSPGRPSERDALLAPLLEECLAQSPSAYGFHESTWSVAMIAELCERKTQRRFSDDTIGRALHDAGYSYKRSRRTVPDTAPSKEEKKEAVRCILNDIRKIMDHEEVEILALDEAHFSTEPYVTRSWCKRGKPFFPPVEQSSTGHHLVWCIQSGPTKIFLEKCETRQCDNLQTVPAPTSPAP